MSIKKTYIPAKPRNKKLIGTGGSGGISSSMSGAVANSHTHANKAVLDLFKQDSDGNVYLEQSFYSMGGISALGLGEGGGGGGGSSVQMEDYGATSISLTVDGLQRYIARSNHNHNIFALEGINPSIGFTEGYVLTWNATTLKLELRAPTGGGGTSASWGVTNNNQSPLTVDGVSKIVSLSGHTHAISNITNLQSTLNNKVDKVTGKSLILDTEIARLANVDNQTLNSLGAEPAFSKNTAFNKNFGTTAGTVAQGDDSRILNGQTAFGWGNHASAGYALNSALTAHINKVDNPHAVTKAQVGLGNVDNVKQATKSEFDTHTGNTTAHITSTERTNWNDANSKKHTHTNKTVLDGITSSLVSNWDDANSKKHTHNNKSTLDGITSTLVTNWDTAYTQRHTHSNKTVIDKLTQSNIDVLNKLSVDSDGNVKVDATLWATGGISALGLGEGGSSGGGVDMLDSWANYTPAKANYYVPSSLLVSFRSDTLSRLTSLESGSATSIVTTGTGNAITSLTKSGSVITANKGLTFALATHTHTIAQVTGLQTALDGKQPTISTGTPSQYYRGDKTWQTLNTSVVSEGTNLYFTNARVKAYGDTLYSLLGHTHTIAQITGLQSALNSKATQSDIDTAIDDIEIGGRNLAQLTNSKEWGTYTGGTISFGEYKGITTIKSTDNGSGYISIQQGSKARKMLLRAGEQYIISLLVRGTVPLGYTHIMNTGIGNLFYGSFTYEQPLNEETFVKAHLKITGTATHELSTGSWFMTRPTVINAGDWVEITQFKIEKGNKATDWTPAPEDQVTDWNETDVNSFAFLKNKPTTLAGYGITDGVNKSLTLTAGSGLTGGGTLGASRTFALGTPSNITTTTTNSVATDSHTHNLALGGTASQYLNGATTLVTIPTITAGNGLSGGGQLTATRALALGTPTTLSNATTNKVTSESHTHAITTTTVGAVNTIVATDASGAVRGNIIRIGGAWTLELSGTELVFKHNGVIKQRMLSDGTILATWNYSIVNKLIFKLRK